MANARRYFRFDVTVPLYYSVVDPDRVQQNLWQQLLNAEDEQKLEALNQSIAKNLANIYTLNPKAFSILVAMNSRLDYFAWLVTGLVQGYELYALGLSYKRRSLDKAYVPQFSKGSLLGEFIGEYHAHLDSHINELHRVVDHSGQIGVYWFSNQQVGILEARSYFSKILPKLEQQDEHQVKVLVGLVKKLNFYEKLMNDLKEAYRQASDPNAWVMQKVNLSAGGIAFFRSAPFKTFSPVLIYMQLDQDLVAVKGKVVDVKKLQQEALIYRHAVAFEVISGEQAHLITLYEQHEELKQAMQNVKL